jgi:hypothetical protein
MKEFIIVRFFDFANIKLVIVKLLCIDCLEGSNEGGVIGSVSTLELIALSRIEFLTAFKKKHQKY